MSSIPWNTTQHLKKKWSIDTHNLYKYLENYDKWKNPITKDCTLCDFIFYNILQMTKYKNEGQSSSYQWLRRVWSWEENQCDLGNMRHPWGNGHVLFLDCIKVNVDLVILSYSVARCYYWEKLHKEHTRSLLFFQVYINLQLFQNRKSS